MISLHQSSRVEPNQRTAPRSPTPMGGVLWIAHPLDGSRWPCSLINVSRSGLLVSSRAAVKIGDQVLVQLRDPAGLDLPRVSGTVVRSRRRGWTRLWGIQLHRAWPGHESRTVLFSGPPRLRLRVRGIVVEFDARGIARVPAYLAGAVFDASVNAPMLRIARPIGSDPESGRPGSGPIGMIEGPGPSESAQP